jgi:MFS family permease
MTQASLFHRLATRGQRSQLFGYNRNVYLLLLFTLGKGMQLSIGQVSILLYVASLGYPVNVVGVVGGMPALGALLAGIPMGFLADRVGRKLLLVVSGILNPLALAAIGLSTSVPLLVAASLANGFLSSAYWVTNLPMLTENTEDNQRVGVFALNNFLLLGVGALGALIGGFVPVQVAAHLHVAANSTVPLRFGVLAAAFVVFLPSLPLIFLDEPWRSRRAAASPAAPASTPALALELEPIMVGAPVAAAVLQAPTAPAQAAAHPAPASAIAAVTRIAIIALFVKLLVPDVLFTTGEGSVVGLLQVYFEKHFSLQVGTIGVLYTVAGLVGGATSLTAPRFVRRFGKLRMATSMQYLSAPAMLAIGLSPFVLMAAVAEFIRQILRGLFEPTYAAFAMESVSTRYRSRLSGFYSVTWSVGYSIGPTLAGFLWRYVGFSASFIVGASCLILSATLLRVFFGAANATRPLA